MHVCVLPADQLLRDEEAFRAALFAAGPSVRAGRLVTFGVVPTRPETGFGWIVPGPLRGGGAAVERFVEKPPLATAEALRTSGALWNAGIFAGSLEAFRAAFSRHLPRTVPALAGCAGAPADEAWLQTEPTSIDFGLMEPLAAAGGLDVVPLDAGWSDVGAWSALSEALGEGPGGAVLAREVVALDSRNNAVVASDKLVALLGVEGLVVVDTPDALLVTTSARAQELRRLVEEVERRTGARYT